MLAGECHKRRWVDPYWLALIATSLYLLVWFILLIDRELNQFRIGHHFDQGGALERQRLLNRRC